MTSNDLQTYMDAGRRFGRLYHEQNPDVRTAPPQSDAAIGWLSIRGTDTTDILERAFNEAYVDGFQAAIGQDVERREW